MALGDELHPGVQWLSQSSGAAWPLPPGAQGSQHEWTGRRGQSSRTRSSLQRSGCGAVGEAGWGTGQAGGGRLGTRVRGLLGKGLGDTAWLRSWAAQGSPAAGGITPASALSADFHHGVPSSGTERSNGGRRTEQGVGGESRAAAPTPEVLGDGVGR